MAASPDEWAFWARIISNSGVSIAVFIVLLILLRKPISSYIVDKLHELQATSEQTEQNTVAIQHLTKQTSLNTEAINRLAKTHEETGESIGDLTRTLARYVQDMEKGRRT